jgi:hypothetical protein
MFADFDHRYTLPF